MRYFPWYYIPTMAFHFTDQNFKIETAKGSSVVDFTATWCGPCKMMAPIFEEVAKQMEGKVKMGKLDVDESPETPASFGIQGVPTIIFFKDGKEVDRLVGFQSKDALTGKLGEAFGF